jgi:hypothetical protein
MVFLIMACVHPAHRTGAPVILVNGLPRCKAKMQSPLKYLAAT